MKLNAKKATKKGQTMRSCIYGGPGSGKTMFALQVAEQFTSDMAKVLVIDTENESSGLYSDRFDFMCHNWEGGHNPEQLAALIAEADRSDDYDFIIVDGATPFWDGKGGVLDIVEEAKKKAGGKNTYAGWGKATPMHNELLEQIRNTRTHLLVTLRAKNTSPEETNEIMASAGAKPVQRDNFLFEFNTAIYIDPNHGLHVVKSRCQDLNQVKKLDVESFSSTINDWLGDNSSYITAAQAKTIKDLFEAVPSEDGRRAAAKKSFIEQYGSPDRLGSDLFLEAAEACKLIVNDYVKEEPFDV